MNQGQRPSGRRTQLRLSRRNFVKLAALAATPLPGVLVEAANALEPEGDGILVVLQLSGGNDGLNTVVPFEDDRYQRARPTLALGKGAVLPLESRSSQDFGFHGAMEGMAELFKEGKVAVVQGVGYESPNRSHFRSMEIWHSARPESESIESGWLGRAVKKGRLEALDIGDSTAPLALAAPGLQVPVLQNLNWLDTLFSSRGRGLRGALGSLLAEERRGDAEFLRGAATSTFTQLEKLEHIRSQKSPVSYPGSSIGRRLEWTGQMIAGGLASRIYYVSMGGYDTHADQGEQHANLLRQFSDAVAAFQKHMDAIGASKRVVLMAFSEFGRRVRENGSRGTDHGAAGPLWVVSDRCRGGFHGEAPDLGTLDHGDLAYTTDFRRVYATVLDDVLGLDPRLVLEGDFERLDLLEGRRRATF